ncbi:hypothetical protein BIY23_03560 [Wolbachia pipientis]|uniref:Uncharacterized protein n=1 Tax=Wolbachia pipientis TaxID=955 RepID=A0A1E7QJ25_WOLPI|nr:hypothetical protein [Wolbachia pipientis]OEY86481.1 hypothetical protein BIY23_03560 [Wolbachia pipientis]
MFNRFCDDLFYDEEIALIYTLRTEIALIGAVVGAVLGLILSKLALSPPIVGGLVGVIIPLLVTSLWITASMSQEEDVEKAVNTQYIGMEEKLKSQNIKDNVYLFGMCLASIAIGSIVDAFAHYLIIEMMLEGILASIIKVLACTTIGGQQHQYQACYCQC